MSVDTSFSQKSFADSLGLPFPLLSDFDAKVTQLYAVDKFYKAGTDLTPFMAPGRGVKFQKDRISASQAFFLIDKQGILRGRWLPGDRVPISSAQMLEMARDLAGKPWGTRYPNTLDDPTDVGDPLGAREVLSFGPAVKGYVIWGEAVYTHGRDIGWLMVLRVNV